MKRTVDEDDGTGRSGLDAVEAAFAENAEDRPARASARHWLPVALPFLSALVGALIAVVSISGGGDLVWVFLLLPYFAVIGALAGAVVGGVASLIVFRVLRR